MPIKGILGFELQFRLCGTKGKAKMSLVMQYLLGINIQFLLCTLWVCADGSSLTCPPLPVLSCDPQNPIPTWERQSCPSCPSRTSTHCRKGKGISSHWAFGFITLLNTRNTAGEMYWKMPRNRNPEQSMFSVLFPSELNMVGNFHTAKELVMAQFCGNGALTRAQISWSSVSFLLWGHSLSKIFSSYGLSAQQMSDAALPLLLLMCFRIIFRRHLRKGTGKLLDRSENVEEVKSLSMVTWKVSGRSSNGQWILLPSKEPLPAFFPGLCLVLWLLLCSSGLGQCPSQVPWLPEVLTGLCFQALL